MSALRFRPAQYTPRQRQPFHSHDELHLSLVVRGGVIETVGRTPVSAGPLTVLAKDAGLRHADEYGRTGATIAQLALPGGTIRALAGGGVGTASWHVSARGAAVAAYLRLVQRSGGRPDRFDATDDDVVALVAALTRRPGPSRRGDPPAWLARVIERVRDDWTPGLTVARLARDAGVHPVYLARMTREWYRTSVGDLLRRSRLRRAVRAVVDGHETLGGVACRTGYADQAHLSRHLSATFGVAPGRLRKLALTLDRGIGAPPHV